MNEEVELRTLTAEFDVCKLLCNILGGGGAGVWLWETSIMLLWDYYYVAVAMRQLL